MLAFVQADACASVHAIIIHVGNNVGLVPSHRADIDKRCTTESKSKRDRERRFLCYFKFHA